MGSSLNLPDDPAVNLARLAERQESDHGQIDVLVDAVFGNGNEGLKATVATIGRDVKEISDKLDESESKREENEMSKRWKIGLICAFALVILGDWAPVIFSLFK